MDVDSSILNVQFIGVETKMTKQIELDSDNMVVYIGGEYYPAQLEYHKNDIVDQHVVAVIEYEIELEMYDEPQLELVVDNDND